jgi:hypothetical protein
MTKTLSMVALAVAAVGLAPPAGAFAASAAPALEPDTWLNNTRPVSWAALKGRAIVVEKWATW